LIEKFLLPFRRYNTWRKNGRMNKYQKYLEQLSDFESLVNIALNISEHIHGIKIDTRREQYGSYIFSKICLHILAIERLLPKSKYHSVTKSFEVWDISSLAILARVLIETYYAFYYLIIDEIDHTELDFRFSLWNFHSEKERLKMLNLIDSKSPELKNVELSVEQYLLEIKNNKYYESLEIHIKRNIRKGQMAFTLSNSNISEKSGIPPNYYKATYKFLSSYVHTYPFSISQLPYFHVDDPSTISIMGTIIDYCTGYLSFSIRDIIKVFPDKSEKLDKYTYSIIEKWEYIYANYNK